MLQNEKLYTEKLKDISTFEHYRPSWDKVIFDIIEKGETSIFDIQDYFVFDWDYREWEVFLDALAYYRYVDFKYPNLTTYNNGKYVLRKVIITKEDFERIIKNRNNSKSEKLSYNLVLQKLNSNLIVKLKKMFPLINYDGKELTKAQEEIIYNHIARDMAYATESHTHINIEYLESYCNEHPLKDNNSYYCKLYEIDDLEEFDTSLSKSMLVFGRYKQSEFYHDILDRIMDNEKHSVEILSLSSSPDIMRNYQIIIIYPKL